jgi:uncharacterized membrane protein YbhN (UPF0104 family)
VVRKYIRPFLAVTVLAVTVFAFVRYVADHPGALHQLTNVSPLTLILLLGLYVVTLACLAFAQEGTLELCRTKLAHGEAFLLTSYTAIINFFGPLQSGPGFRAVYLKKKYGTKLRNYAFATFLYYLFYVGISALFLLSAFVSWTILAIAALAVTVLCILGIRLNIPVLRRFRELKLTGAVKLGLATTAQLLVVSLIYFTELKTVDPSVHFSQALIYTGAANFALFVSVTPGAIGFRESFLLFSQNLHHISDSNIVSASLLDRGMYIVFLGLLFLAVIGLHAKEKLRPSSPD